MLIAKSDSLRLTSHWFPSLKLSISLNPVTFKNSRDFFVCRNAMKDLLLTIGYTRAIATNSSLVKPMLVCVVWIKCNILSQKVGLLLYSLRVVSQKLNTFSLKGYEISIMLVLMHRNMSILLKSLSRRFDKMLMISTVNESFILVLRRKMRWMTTDVIFSMISGFSVWILHKAHFKSKSALSMIKLVSKFYKVYTWTVVNLKGVARLANGSPNFVNKKTSL